MSDLDLGMNNWMSDPFEYPTTPINRGKVFSKEDLDRLGGFARYKDVDGDGIGYRTLAGNHSSRGGLLRARQRPQRRAQYSERADDFENNMERLNRKFETARSFVPRPEITKGNKGAKERSELSATGRRIGASLRAAINCATNTRLRPTTCGCGRIPSLAKCTSSSSSTIEFTWSSRIATRRCSLCSDST